MQNKYNRFSRLGSFYSVSGTRLSLETVLQKTHSLLLLSTSANLCCVTGSSKGEKDEQAVVQKLGLFRPVVLTFLCPLWIINVVLILR